MNEIPSWAAFLVAIGEKTAATVDGKPSRGLTVALCLPRVEYAAALIGLGIVKARFSAFTADSQKERMANLLGKWVSFERTSKTVIGVLEFCQIEKTYQIKVENKRGHVLWIVIDPEDWAKVRPTGREFNFSRRISQKQTQRVDEQNHSISILSQLMGCDLGESALSRSGCLFCVYGNKTRINQELADSLFKDEEACLVKVLRPKGHVDYEDSFHCSLEGHKSEMPDDGATIMIIESGRSLPDQLAASRNLNRIVLLGRNSVNYDECTAQIMDDFTNRRADGPEPDAEVPESIKYLAFYHL